MAWRVHWFSNDFDDDDSDGGDRDDETCPAVSAIAETPEVTDRSPPPPAGNSGDETPEECECVCLCVCVSDECIECVLYVLASSQSSSSSGSRWQYLFNNLRNGSYGVTVMNEESFPPL